MSVDFPEFGFPTIATVNPDLIDSEKLKAFFSFSKSFSKIKIVLLIFLINPTPPITGVGLIFFLFV